MVVTTGLIINGQLDPKKLETSLSSLIAKNFPRAGAQLALRNGVNSSSLYDLRARVFTEFLFQVYEFHIPHAFGTRTPPVVFTAEDHPEPYASPARTPTIAKFSVTGRLTLNVKFGVQQRLVRKAFSYF
jgi:hypothetical protein